MFCGSVESRRREDNQVLQSASDVTADKETIAASVRVPGGAADPGGEQDQLGPKPPVVRAAAAGGAALRAPVNNTGAL